MLACDWKELLALVEGGKSQGKRAKEKRAIPTTPMIDADPVAEDDMRRWQDLWKAVVAPLTDKYMKSATGRVLEYQCNVLAGNCVSNLKQEFSQYLQFVATFARRLREI